MCAIFWRKWSICLLLQRVATSHSSPIVAKVQFSGQYYLKVSFTSQNLGWILHLICFQFCAQTVKKKCCFSKEIAGRKHPTLTSYLRPDSKWDPTWTLDREGGNQWRQTGLCGIFSYLADPNPHLGNFGPILPFFPWSSELGCGNEVVGEKLLAWKMNFFSQL